MPLWDRKSDYLITDVLYKLVLVTLPPISASEIVTRYKNLA